MAKKNKELMNQIRAMEDKARAEALRNAQPAPQNDAGKVEFDLWYHMRAQKIPGHHMKEILKADFKGRGLGDKETMEVYDKALEKYGVKLK